MNDPHFVHIARSSPKTEFILRFFGALLLLVIGAIHLYLWFQGFYSVSVIGPLFLANAGFTFLFSTILMFRPKVWSGFVGMMLAASTFAAYLISVSIGLFGFHNTFSAPLAIPAAVVEICDVVILGTWVWIQESKKRLEVLSICRIAKSGKGSSRPSNRTRLSG